MDHAERFLQLDYQWISSKGIEMKGTCSLIHQGSCSMEFLKKILTVSKIGLKYYLPFHLFPLLLKLRQTKNPQQVISVIFKRLYYYMKSILFMTILVATTKNSLCFYSRNINRLQGWILIPSSAIAALGIFLQQSSRQQQIGYFVLAKALRSIFMIFKRKGFIHIPKEQIVMHIILMTVFYYFYCHHPSMIKFRSIFDELWGQA